MTMRNAPFSEIKLQKLDEKITTGELHKYKFNHLRADWVKIAHVTMIL